MNKTLFFIGVLCVGISFGGVAAAADFDLSSSPKQYFESLLARRASVKSLHVKWTMTILNNLRTPQIEECRHELEGWYDYQSGACRVNAQVDCPQAKQLNASPRFAFDGAIYRIIERDDVLGFELHGIDKYHMSTDKSRVYDQSTDLRLLGLFPVSFALLKNFSLASLSSYTNTPQAPSVEKSNGKTLIRIEGFLSPDGSALVELDLESMMPSRIETKIENGQLRELQCTWEKYSDHNDGSTLWFPKTVKTRTWDDGKTLSYEELVSVKAVDVGIPLSKSQLEWKALAPHDKYAVETRENGKRVNVAQWDVSKEGFVPWEPKPLFVERSADLHSDKGSVRSWLVVLNILVILGIVAWIVSKQLKPRFFS